MHRRDFLAASAAAVVGAAASRTSRAAETPHDRHWIDIRTYHFASAEKQKAYERLLAAAGVAAFRRAGAGPVGIFRLLAEDNPKLDPKPDETDLWVILPHGSAEALAGFEARLAEDKAYQEAGRGLLDAAKTDPAFTRYDSMLLLAFEGFPRLTPPAELNDARVLEMRLYQSHNQERHANKVAMFNDGEIPIFAKAGMPPVFFGAGVAGLELPHLTYMVHHASMEASKNNWGAFRDHPDWVKMRVEPQYRDNVSRVITRFLRPAAGSQI